MRRPLRNWPRQVVAEEAIDIADEAAQLSNRFLASDPVAARQLSRMCRQLHQLACRVKELSG